MNWAKEKLTTFFHQKTPQIEWKKKKNSSKLRKIFTTHTIKQNKDTCQKYFQMHKNQ